MARIVVYDSNVKRHLEYHDLLLGHEVIGSTDFNTAIETVKGVNPALVLIDSGDENGLRLISEIRRLPGMAAVMIYLMGEVQSPNDFSVYRKAASKCGANGFIPRPIQNSFLQLMVNRALNYNQGFNGPNRGVDQFDCKPLVEDVQPKKPEDDQSGVFPPTINLQELHQTVSDSWVGSFSSSISLFCSSDRSLGRNRNLTLEEDNNPLGNIAEMVGGWKELSDIAYAFDIPSDPEEHRRLLNILDGWGKKKPRARIAKAEEIMRLMTDLIQRNGRDPVYLALLWIANTAVQRTKQNFWLMHCSKLVELIGEWLILSEILEQSEIDDPAELDRLLHHLKLWNDQEPNQIMVKAAGYCCVEFTDSDRDPVAQVLKQIASEILFGSEIMRLQWEGDDFSDENDRAA